MDKKLLYHRLEKVNWIRIVLSFTLVALLLNNALMNYFKLDDYLHSDIVAEMSYIQAILKYHNLLPFNWVNSQELFINRPFFITAPLYAVTGNMMLSYKISVITGTWLLLISLAYLLKQLNISYNGILLACCFILSPVLTNNVTILFLNSYVMFPIVFMLTLGYYIKDNYTNSNINKPVFISVTFLVVSFAMGLSGPRMLLVLYIPLLLIELIHVFVTLKNNEKLKRKYLYNGLTLCLANLFGLLIYKKIIIGFIGHTSIDSFKLAPLGKIASNVLINTKTLLMSSDINLTTRDGVLIFIIFITIVGYFLAFDEDKSKKAVILMFGISILGVFSYLSITEVLATERYYFVSIYFLVIIMILGIERVLSINKTAASILTMWLLIYIQINSANTYIPMYGIKGNVNQKQLANYLTESGYTEVYASYWNSSILKGLTNGELNTGHFWESFEPFLWLTDKSLYEDKVIKKEVAIILTDREEQIINERNDTDSDILKRLKKKKEIGEYNVYATFNNPVVKVSFPRKKGDTTFYSFSNRSAQKNATEVNFDEDYIITNRMGGIVTWGPYIKTSKGVYDFVLTYELIESKVDVIGYLDIALNGAKEIKAKKDLVKDSTTVELHNIEFKSDNEILEFRVFANNGTVLKLKNIKMLRK